MEDPRGGDGLFCYGTNSDMDCGPATQALQRMGGRLDGGRTGQVARCRWWP